MRRASWDICAIQAQGRPPDSTVEDRLRTYLTAGISPNELEEEYRVLDREYCERERAKQEADFIGPRRGMAKYHLTTGMP